MTLNYMFASIIRFVDGAFAKNFRLCCDIICIQLWCVGCRYIYISLPVLIWILSFLPSFLCCSIF